MCCAGQVTASDSNTADGWPHSAALKGARLKHFCTRSLKLCTLQANSQRNAFNLVGGGLIQGAPLCAVVFRDASIEDHVCDRADAQEVQPSLPLLTRQVPVCGVCFQIRERMFWLCVHCCLEAPRKILSPPSSLDPKVPTC